MKRVSGGKKSFPLSNLSFTTVARGSSEQSERSRGTAESSPLRSGPDATADAFKSSCILFVAARHASQLFFFFRATLTSTLQEPLSTLNNSLQFCFNRYFPFSFTVLILKSENCTFVSEKKCIQRNPASPVIMQESGIHRPS